MTDKEILDKAIRLMTRKLLPPEVLQAGIEEMTGADQHTVIEFLAG